MILLLILLFVGCSNNYNIGTDYHLENSYAGRVNVYDTFGHRQENQVCDIDIYTNAQGKRKCRATIYMSKKTHVQEVSYEWVKRNLSE